MIQRGCTAAPPLFREFMEAAILELASRLVVLEHRIGTPIPRGGSGAGQANAQALSGHHHTSLHAQPSGRIRVYSVPAGFSLPRDKALCAPCAHHAIHVGIMKATDPPVAAALHAKDPSTKPGEKACYLIGECPLTKDQRSHFRNILQSVPSRT